MTHLNHNEELFEEEARIAGVFSIGLIGDPEHPPQWLVDLYEAADTPEHSLFASLPELKHDAEDASEWAHVLVIGGRKGLIVNYEACIRQYTKPGSTSWFSGWGLYRTGYVVVDTFDQVGPAVLAAVRQHHEADQAKAGAV